MGQDRRTTIKTAAVTVLAECGPRGFTHRAVDSAAGLVAGSVNYYAPSRGRLLLLACEEVLDRDADAARRAFDPSTSPTVAEMVDATRAYVDAMSTGPGASCTIARHHLEGEALVHPELAAAINSRRRRIADAVRGQLGRTGSPVSEASVAFFQIQLDGVVSRQALFPLAALPPAHVNEIVERLIRSVGRDVGHTDPPRPDVPAWQVPILPWYPPEQHESRRPRRR